MTASERRSETPEPISDDDRLEPGWRAWEPPIGPLTRDEWLTGLIVTWRMRATPPHKLVESFRDQADNFRAAALAARDLAFEIRLYGPRWQVRRNKPPHPDFTALDKARRRAVRSLVDFDPIRKEAVTFLEDVEADPQLLDSTWPAIAKLDELSQVVALQQVYQHDYDRVGRFGVALMLIAETLSWYAEGFEGDRDKARAHRRGGGGRLPDLALQTMVQEAAASGVGMRELARAVVRAGIGKGKTSVEEWEDRFKKALGRARPKKK